MLVIPCKEARQRYLLGASNEIPFSFLAMRTGSRQQESTGVQGESFAPAFERHGFPIENGWHGYRVLMFVNAPKAGLSDKRR
jgi:hypothetical protein